MALEKNYETPKADVKVVNATDVIKASGSDVNSAPKGEWDPL